MPYYRYWFKFHMIYLSCTRRRHMEARSPREGMPLQERKHPSSPYLSPYHHRELAYEAVAFGSDLSAPCYLDFPSNLKFPTPGGKRLGWRHFKLTAKPTRQIPTRNGRPHLFTSRNWLRLAAPMALHRSWNIEWWIFWRGWHSGRWYHLCWSIIRHRRHRVSYN